MSTGLKLCIMEVNKFPSAAKMWSFGGPREERVSQPPAAGRVLETDQVPCLGQKPAVWPVYLLSCNP